MREKRDYRKELEEREDQVDGHLQLFDEIIVAFGSLGIIASDLPRAVEDLIKERDTYKRVLRHIEKGFLARNGMLDLVEKRDGISRQDAIHRVSESQLKSIRRQVSEALAEGGQRS